MTSSATGTDTPAKLRGAMVDHWRTYWRPFAAPVEDAMRTVPRHLFLPGIPVEEAYVEDVVVTHRDSDGTVISSASMPSIVAEMLEQLDVRPGQRVLEVGAGTGYNAALLAHMVGPSGAVTTVDIAPDVTAGARRNLAAAGYGTVRVVWGDGEHGYAANAPYDRIIVTACAWDLPPAWREQVAPDGRIVVPLRIRGFTRSVALERDGQHWRSVSCEPSGFIPLRGAGHYPERDVPLDSDGKAVLRVDTALPADPDALRHAVGSSPLQSWTGVTIPRRGLSGLDFWLAALDGLGRLIIRSPGHNLVAPAFQGGSMAVADHDTFAYLMLRPANGTDGNAESEIGICAYGPSSEQLASRMAARIQAWSAESQSLTTPWIEVYPADTLVPMSGNLLVADKRHARVIVRASAR